MSSGFKLRKTYRVGYCTSFGKIAKKALGWKKVRFIARAFLLEHPKHGLILVDTGYGRPFFDATQSGFGWLYGKLLPVTLDPSEGLVEQLANDGISKGDLSYVLITHFHPDHIGALKDFAEVPWIFRKSTLEELQALSPWKAFRHGFLNKLVPKCPVGSIDAEASSFTKGRCDLFGDGSLTLMDLPGHALGQMGVLLSDCVLAADAAWDIDELPHALGIFVQHDSQAYKKTHLMLQQFKRKVIPTHLVEPL